MYRFLGTLALFVIALAPAGVADEPQLIAARFHADWCGSCAKIGPIFEDLANKFDGQSVLFVTYDRTNQTTSHQAALLAAALDQDKLYAEHEGTGFVLLIDADSGEVRARLGKEQTLKQMGNALKGELDG